MNFSYNEVSIFLLWPHSNNIPNGFMVFHLPLCMGSGGSEEIEVEVRSGEEMGGKKGGREGERAEGRGERGR